ENEVHVYDVTGSDIINVDENYPPNIPPDSARINGVNTLFGSHNRAYGSRLNTVSGSENQVVAGYGNNILGHNNGIFSRITPSNPGDPAVYSHTYENTIIGRDNI